MKASEFYSLPITDKVMFGSEMIWDEKGAKWWVGLLDGKPHRRQFGASFSVARFTVWRGEDRAEVSIPYQVFDEARLTAAAKKWGSDYFNCPSDDLKVQASS